MIASNINAESGPIGNLALTGNRVTDRIVYPRPAPTHMPGPGTKVLGNTCQAILDT
jgi:hypothetical protein